MKWNKKWTTRVFAYSFPLVMLLGMGGKPLLTTLTGEEIRLKTAPVDPRDLFRGDYVELTYEAEEIDVKKLEPELFKKLSKNISKENMSELTVYVTLTEDKDGIASPTKVGLEKPETNRYLKGELDAWSFTDDTSTVFVAYSLDKYFVGENTGTALEKGSREGRTVATVKVRNGYPVLQKVEIDGNR